MTTTPEPRPDPAQPPAATATPQSATQPRPPTAESSEAAAEFLSRLQGAGEVRAAVLALMLPAASQRAARAWHQEAEGVGNATEVLEHVTGLLPNARLPWFERMLKRMRRHPIDARQALLESTRRVMAARGGVRPIDRLHWFSMRQRLGEATPASARHAADIELSQLPDAEVHAIAIYTAFLSRMIPLQLPESPSDDERAAGPDWYLRVMSAWPQHEVPALQLPDTDALLHALQHLQSMPWMQRPVLARTWVDAALVSRHRGRLRDEAADALRLSCALLDSPLPPELAKQFIEPPEEVRK